MVIFRNDFMYDVEIKNWLQVEFNTFSVGGAMMSDFIQKTQDNLMRSYSKEFLKHK